MHKEFKTPNSNTEEASKLKLYFWSCPYCKLITSFREIFQALVTHQIPQVCTTPLARSEENHQYATSHHWFRRIVIEFFSKWHKCHISDIFVQNLTSKEFKISKKSCFQWESNSQHQPSMDRILMPYKLSQSVSPCQSQSFRPLQSCFIEWSRAWNKIQFSSIQHMSGWQSETGIMPSNP